MLRAYPPPPGYYDSVDTTNAVSLRASLHAIIDDHQRFPYTSSGTDAWDILELADEDPNNAARILDVYRNASYLKAGGGNANYDREHTWPNSYGFPNDGSTNYPYTDCHQLFLANSSYNSSRGNKPFAHCGAGCTERVTEFNNGQGGGSGTYPGQSNWTAGSGATGQWETWVGRRGDVARALFYLDVRYEGGTHGLTGAAEPDLILTDNVSLISASNTGSNLSVAYMGFLSVLLQWHVEDPVDDRERMRNDVVFSFQGNRNPFIDHPEWVNCVFTTACDAPGPSIPTGLTATGGDAIVHLNWNDNPEPDLDGYNLYRATSASGPFDAINGSRIAVSAFEDTAVTNGVTYYYRVTAIDTDENESPMSIVAAATPVLGGAPTGPVWINEIHYDNVGTDVNEGVEIAGPAGVNLMGWQLIGYNGNGFAQYATINLSGVIPDQQNGFGTLWFPFLGLQNGSPDGIALIDPDSTVIQFLSYEGSITAADGVASGMTSTDIGVSQTASTPVDFSLQLQGTGSQYADFTWTPPSAQTRGNVNNNQTFEASDPVPAASTWSMVVLALLLTVVATLLSRRTQVST